VHFVGSYYMFISQCTVQKRNIHTDVRNDVCNEYVSCVVVVGEWNVIMERRWKDTDKREQNSLRETHLSVILSTMNQTLTYQLAEDRDQLGFCCQH